MDDLGEKKGSTLLDNMVIKVKLQVSEHTGKNDNKN